MEIGGFISPLEPKLRAELHLQKDVMLHLLILRPKKLKLLANIGGKAL